DVPLDKFTPQEPAAGTVDELFKLEKKVLFNIIDHMHIALSPQKKAELERPLSTNTAALLALFAGIDYSDRGLYLRAANMYEQALIEDPGLKMAQNALLELKGMGLVTPEELNAEKEPQPTLPTPETDDGLSTGNIVAIGLGMAAVGGGIALALGQSDDDSSSTPAADPEDTTPPTVTPDPAENIVLDCAGGNVLFSFSEAMADAGEVLLSNGGSVQQGWRGDRVYEISWSSDASICNNSSDITVTLNGFKDISENPLTEPTRFTYSARYNYQSIYQQPEL
ncbi:hypothetical protein VU10_06940, partial [Desulfobulbus sp. US1]|nr:hypothetical protein [Desulfobulbus sp. US1]